MENKEQTIKKESPIKGSSLWGILIFALLIFIDQITKALAVVYLEGRQDTIWLIGDFVGLEIVYNRGISYGIGEGAKEITKIAVIVATAVVMTVLAIAYFKTDKRRSLLRNAFVFIVAGGIGNLIDRVYYKVWISGGADGVRDMVNLQKLGFAVCNFADFFITAGAIMLVLSFLFFDRDAFFPAGKYKLLAKEAEEKRAKEEEVKNKDK